MLQPVAESWFLKIDGIDGDSLDKVHKGEIDILAWSWGVANEAPHSSGGAGAGRASSEDFHFVARISQASPQLFLSCATGAHHKMATLSGRKAADKSAGDFLKYKLSDVLVTSVHHSDGPSDAPTEQFTLGYGRFEITFTPSRPDGTPGTPVSAGFDVKMNKKA
jgi:type VI secretion system secreted protein Hcp